MDLLIKKFPDGLVHKLKLQALKGKVTLKAFIIQILTKEINSKANKNTD